MCCFCTLAHDFEQFARLEQCSIIMIVLFYFMNISILSAIFIFLKRIFKMRVGCSNVIFYKPFLTMFPAILNQKNYKIKIFFSCTKQQENDCCLNVFLNYTNAVLINLN